MGSFPLTHMHGVQISHDKIFCSSNKVCFRRPGQKRHRWTTLEADSFSAMLNSNLAFFNSHIFFTWHGSLLLVLFYDITFREITANRRMEMRPIDKESLCRLLSPCQCQRAAFLSESPGFYLNPRIKQTDTNRQIETDI